MREETIAFVMWCDQNALTYYEGIHAAEDFADELLDAAEDRHYADKHKEVRE